MDKDLAFLVFVLLIFNGATIKLLSRIMATVNLKDTLREKSTPAAPSDGMPEMSYSRLAGLIGAVIMATFFWAAGNIVIYKSVHSPSEISSFIGSISSYMLGGAALFVPYATNQLREAFKIK